MRDGLGLGRLCIEFYKKLYTAPILLPECLDAIQLILNTIEQRLHGDGRHRLFAPLTLSKIEATAKDLAHGKSLSPNGLAIEFYLKLCSR